MTLNAMTRGQTDGGASAERLQAPPIHRRLLGDGWRWVDPGLVASPPEVNPGEPIAVAQLRRRADNDRHCHVGVFGGCGFWFRISHEIGDDTRDVVRGADLQCPLDESGDRSGGVTAR